MKNNDDLFVLIKSLSKSEKKYFSLYASRVSSKGESNYLRLFNAIDKQETYDEEKIKKQFTGEGFVRFLASTKHELYNALLRSLHAYHEESSAEARLRQVLHYAEILAAKGLEKHARSQVRIAREIAQKHELLNYIPEVLNLELSLADRDDREAQDVLAENFYESYQDTIRKLENLALYEKRLKEVRQLTHRLAYGQRTTSDVEQIEDFLQHREIRRPEEAQTVMAQYYYNDIHVYAAFVHADYEKVYEHSSRLVQLAQEHKAILQHDTSRYITILHHYANACSTVGRIDEMENAARMLQAIETHDERLKARIFQYTANILYNVYLARGNYESAAQHADQVEEDLPRHWPLMQNVFRVIICGQSAYTLFLLEKYNRSLKWLNEALNLTQAGHREDITLMLRVLEILLHFELGNMDLVEYRLKSLYRYLSTKPEEHHTESVFITYIRKMTGVQGREQLRDLFTGMKVAIEEVQREHPKEKRYLAQLNLVAWLQGKIENKPFREILGPGSSPIA